MDEQLRTLSTISTLDEILNSVKWDSSHFFEEPIHVGFSSPVKTSFQTQTDRTTTSNASTQVNVEKKNQGCEFFVEMNTTSTQTVDNDTDLWKICCILDENIKNTIYQTELNLGQVRSRLDAYLLQLNNLVPKLETLKNRTKIQTQRMTFEKSILLLEAEEEKSRQIIQIEEINKYFVISLQRAGSSEQLYLNYLTTKDILPIDDQEKATITCNSSVSDHGRRKVAQVTPNHELCMLLDECCAVLDD